MSRGLPVVVLEHAAEPFLTADIPAADRPDASTAWKDASDGKLEERRYLCQNWRAGASAVLTTGGKMVEWAKHSAYGVPFALPAGDTDSDGDWDATDSANITGGGTYDVRKDTDLDGDVDTVDANHAKSITGGYQTLGRGVLSSSAVGNRRGYAGYEYDPTFEGAGRHLYHVRHRVYDAGVGRWTLRDPLGYVDGMSLYEYARSGPVIYLDPFGLDTATSRSDETPWPPKNSPGPPYIIPNPIGKPPYAPGTIVPKRPPGFPAGTPVAPPKQPHAVCEDTAAMNACIAGCPKKIENDIVSEYNNCLAAANGAHAACYALCPAPGGWGASGCRFTCDILQKSAAGLCEASRATRRVQQLTGILQGMCKAECHARHQYIVFGMNCPPGWTPIVPYFGPPAPKSISTPSLTAPPTGTPKAPPPCPTTVPTPDGNGCSANGTCRT